MEEGREFLGRRKVVGIVVVEDIVVVDMIDIVDNVSILEERIVVDHIVAIVGIVGNEEGKGNVIDIAIGRKEARDGVAVDMVWWRRRRGRWR